MATAFLAAQRSKDPTTQVGACIVNDERKIVATGYNGFPNGCSDTDFPWDKSGKHLYVCHAEQNAILNKNTTAHVRGCSMYVALFPCNECAKIIIQSGIHEVVYMSDKHAHKPETIASKRMFTATGVRFWQFQPRHLRVVIDFMAADIGINKLTLSSPPQKKQQNNHSSPPPPPPSSAMRRTNYLTWTDYFMASAFLAAQRSKDPNTQVGACIINDDHKLVGIGYNGFPKGCDDDIFPWSRDAADPLERKYFYVCHAEINAITNRNCSDVRGCTIYVTLFPCNECAKFIIQSGLKRVVYMSDKYADTAATMAAKKMFKSARVEWSQYVPEQERVVIDFGDIDRKSFCQLPGSPYHHKLDEIM